MLSPLALLKVPSPGQSDVDRQQLHSPRLSEAQICTLSHLLMQRTRLAGTGSMAVRGHRADAPEGLRDPTTIT